MRAVWKRETEMSAWLKGLLEMRPMDFGCSVGLTHWLDKCEPHGGRRSSGVAASKASLLATVANGPLRRQGATWNPGMCQGTAWQSVNR